KGIEDEIEEKKENLESIEDRIERKDTRLEELEESFSKSRLEELEEEEDSLEKLLEVLEMRSRVEEKKEELEEVEEEIEKLKFNPEELEEVKDRLSDSRSDIKLLQNKAESKTELKEEKQKRLEDLKEKEENVEELKEEIDRIENIRDFLHRFETGLKETQEEMRKYFTQKTNQVMQKIWSRIYPYTDYTSIKLEAGEDYVLKLKDDRGGWIPAKGEVSGGERHSAALTLRIALSTVLAPELRVLMLDEPTHNLDSRAVADLGETLEAEVAEIVDQVFVITHDEQLENAVTASLYKMEKDLDSGLTQAERQFS
ncbi:MAG: AAA family ATPase, partial [Candidatus Nanohaloarchaea archaeon]|nr:AAA family ATPase [Candidatus Nanohaloarchaea archaeon]